MNRRGLPANIFFGTGIPTVILVLRQKREHTDILIVDASKYFVKEGKNNRLQASDIKRIADTVIQRRSVAKFSRVVSKAEIRQNDYNLNIPRYVDSAEDGESWDLHAIMLGGIPQKEINQLGAYWQAFPQLRETLFTAGDYAQLCLQSDLLKEHITQHPEVRGFSEGYRRAFGDFEDFLNRQLIENWQEVNRNQQEAILSEDLFARLQAIPLIDKYQAYQLLNNHWQVIGTDLEILQTEGFEASKLVDPNLVVKKKNGQDTEVQDGWKGHVLPFELAQGVYLSEQLQTLKQKENRLAEISAELEAVLDSLSEEEKEAETVKEGKDGFVNAVVAREAKQLRQEAKKNGAFAQESYEAKILQVDGLVSEEKALKAAVKTAADALHLKTKATIEGLTDAQAQELLALKWIRPLLTELMALPEGVINRLTAQVQALADKYAVTYGAVAQEISQTEQSLAGLMDELTGAEADMLGLAELKLMLGGN